MNLILCSLGGIVYCQLKVNMLLWLAGVSRYNENTQRATVLEGRNIFRGVGLQK